MKTTKSGISRGKLLSYQVWERLYDVKHYLDHIQIESHMVATWHVLWQILF